MYCIAKGTMCQNHEADYLKAEKIANGKFANWLITDNKCSKSTQDVNWVFTCFRF